MLYADDDGPETSTSGNGDFFLRSCGFREPVVRLFAATPASVEIRRETGFGARSLAGCATDRRFSRSSGRGSHEYADAVGDLRLHGPYRRVPADG